MGIERAFDVQSKMAVNKVSRIETAIKCMSMTKQFVVYVFYHILELYAHGESRRSNIYEYFFVSDPKSHLNDSETKM